MTFIILKMTFFVKLLRKMSFLFYQRIKIDLNLLKKILYYGIIKTLWYNNLRLRKEEDIILMSENVLPY